MEMNKIIEVREVVAISAILDRTLLLPWICLLILQLCYRQLYFQFYAPIELGLTSLLHKIPKVVYDLVRARFFLF